MKILLILIVIICPTSAFCHEYLIDQAKKMYLPVFLEKQSGNGHAKKTIDLPFIFISIGTFASSGIDIKTTFDALRRCPHCYEANPLMRPFVKAGLGPTIAIQVAIDSSITILSYKIKNSDHPKLRKWWWLVPAVTIGIHTYSIVHNRNVGR